ncbi:MAG: hypothetical protein F4180_05390 [Chloroflexi bacterium]|nr:hypothetical protein [Chloroflexota bacterium]
MSQFNDRVRDSAALSHLRETGELLNELVERDWQYQTTKDLINRMVVVVKHVLGRMTIVDRNLVTESSLNQLNQPSYELLHYVDNLSGYADDQEPDTHYGSSLTDQVLDVAYNLPVFPIRTTPGVIQRVADQFEAEMQSKTTRLREQFDETTSSDSALSERIGQLENLHEELADQFEQRVQQSVTRVEDLAKDHRARIQAGTEQMENEANTIQQTFSNSQRTRDESFQKSELLREVEFKDQLKANSDEIDGLTDQARRMLEEVAGASTAEHYSKLREEQNKAANRWRLIGVGFLGAWFISSVVVTFFSGLDFENGGAISLIWRVSVLSPFVIAGAYALRQSGHHRQREEDISRVANELVLLWPFINRLPDEDRQTILRDITPLYFKGGLSAHDPGDDVGLAGRLRDAIPSRPRQGE